MQNYFYDRERARLTEAAELIKRVRVLIDQSNPRAATVRTGGRHYIEHRKEWLEQLDGIGGEVDQFLRGYVPAPRRAA